MGLSFAKMGIGRRHKWGGRRKGMDLIKGLLICWGSHSVMM